MKIIYLAPCKDTGACDLYIQGGVVSSLYYYVTYSSDAIAAEDMHKFKFLAPKCVP